MPAFCAVFNCRDKYGHSEFISYHKFPTKRKDIFEKWLEFAQRGPDWQPSKWSAVCSRHFREEDFSCVNERKTLKKTAIPTIIMLEHAPEQPAEEQQNRNKNREMLPKNSNKSKRTSGVEEDEIPSSAEQQLSEHCQNTVNAPKINCRLCGNASAMVVTFANNFEIYGMIQKCFPTLNIQQDDYLPKEMCRICLKRLEDFSRFIDEVLETQSELQRKFRLEKPASNRNMSERQLKIKQEPVVRVKQELAEGYESFLSDDMDMGVDENCEQEHDNGNASEHFEQKYEFCDFPMLNAQDIINNCDIMEIINLDDPFIDIPDDDANTINNSVNNELNVASSNTTDRLKGDLQSAHELLQTHMLIEEHNYAKEDWNFYKKEKTEGYEYVTNVAQLQQSYEQHSGNLTTTLLPNVQQQLPLTSTSSQSQNSQPHSSEFVSYFSAPRNELRLEETTRSAKPIVTSVSAIAESHETRDARLQFTDSSESPNTPATIMTTKKPNIVVLNESIVQSSAAFQLHACNVCQLKFFSLDSLSQHYVTTHNQMPMVTVPNVNITMSEAQARAAINEDLETDRMQNCKVEQGCEIDDNCADNAASLHAGPAYNTTDQQAAIATETTSNESEVTSSAKALHDKSKNHIDILEMQQTFHRQAITVAAMADAQNQIYYNHSHNTPYVAVNDTITNTTVATAMEDSVFKTPTALPMRRQQYDVVAANEYTKRSKIKSKLGLKKYKTRLYLTGVAENYRQLQRRYRQLQRKCEQLEQRNELPAPRANKIFTRCSAACRKCKRTFPRIQQLLQHKQTKKHYFAAKAKHFSASCYGCEKFFRSKIALRNHMRYICQSLSLRCLKKQMQTFKCRHCRSITFTHWRLYRRHELKCKKQLQSKKNKKMHKEQQLLQYIRTCLIKQRYVQHAHKDSKKQTDAKANKLQTVLKQAQSQLQPQSPPTQKQLFPCPDCSKSFATLNTYNQHRITHTVERTHKCALCARVFKRRNGLMQHVKGFHLELKPYKCPICAHSYALKCDMLRCRHSTLRRC